MLVSRALTRCCLRRAAGDNYNRGEVVRIKVRRRGGGFESFEHVLKVLLHELCHNEHGPHSASFYKLLDDITQARAHAQCACAVCASAAASAC